MRPIGRVWSKATHRASSTISITNVRSGCCARDKALRDGLEAFANGRYDQAADFFTLATQLDNGDAASRIHAAQAYFALEQYADAVPLVRRALELQPRLVYLKFDLRRDYGNPQEFNQQLQHLAGLLARHPDWQDGYLLLGYELLYSGQRAAAHRALARAVSLNPTDKLAGRLYKASIPLPHRPAPRVRPSMHPATDKGTRA